MALNPFFLQGSVGEQNLMQELINEQLKIYGVEITYIPRKIVNRSTVFEELERSKFDDNFLLEAYVETFDGYGGQGDIMTKFGMTLKDELTVSISRERFEDFIAPFMEAMPDDEMIIDTRPREGDLVFFPLGNRLFEVKFVEHEDPFYQFGKLFTYKLTCELFQYSGETGGADGILDGQVDEGFIVKYYYDSITGAPSIGETVTGGTSGTTAKVNLWNTTESWVELRAFNGEFQTGETLTGSDSGFTINITTFDELNIKDAYADNLDFETLGDNLLDFTEVNPFGEFGNRS